MIPGRRLHQPGSEAGVGPGTVVRGRREQCRARPGPLDSQWETGAKPQGLFSCAV